MSLSKLLYELLIAKQACSRAQRISCDPNKNHAETILALLEVQQQALAVHGREAWCKSTKSLALGASPLSEGTNRKPFEDFTCHRRAIRRAVIRPIRSLPEAPGTASLRSEVALPGVPTALRRLGARRSGRSWTGVLQTLEGQSVDAR